MTSLSRSLSIAFLLLSTSVGAEELDPKTWETMSTLFQRAGGQYQKKEHQKAIESYTEVLNLIPPSDEYGQLRLRVHYSLAQNYALLGKHKESLASLTSAVDSGLADLTSIVRNDDFAAVRKTDGYLDVEKRAARKLEELRARARDAQKNKLAGLKSFDFDLTDIDGKKVARKDFAGKVLIVDVWGTWCPPCIQEVPHFVALKTKFEKEGLAIVGLNSEKVSDPKDATARIRATAERLKINYPCALVTQDLLRKIPGFQAFPTTLVFGRDGTPRAMEVGARSYEDLEAIVKPLLAEKAEASATPAKS